MLTSCNIRTDRSGAEVSCNSFSWSLRPRPQSTLSFASSILSIGSPDFYCCDRPLLRTAVTPPNTKMRCCPRLQTGPTFLPPQLPLWPPISSSQPHANITQFSKLESLSENEGVFRELKIRVKLAVYAYPPLECVIRSKIIITVWILISKSGRFLLSPLFII